MHFKLYQPPRYLAIYNLTYKVWIIPSLLNDCLLLQWLDLNLRLALVIAVGDERQIYCSDHRALYACILPNPKRYKITDF